MESLLDMKTRHLREILNLINERANATELLAQQTTAFWNDAVGESGGNKQTIDSLIRIAASVADFAAIFDKKLEKMEKRHRQELLVYSDCDHEYS